MGKNNKKPSTSTLYRNWQKTLERATRAEMNMNEDNDSFSRSVFKKWAKRESKDHTAYLESSRQNKKSNKKGK